MATRACIVGVSGTVLADAERAFLRDAQPWGLILFKRNVETPAQVAALTASFREAVGRDAPVLVDQEGGRVQRLGPPHWPAYPPGATFGRVGERLGAALGEKAARLGHTAIANDLIAVGIDVDCAPVADVPAAEADPIIGDRAYGTAPAAVPPLAGAGGGGRRRAPGGRSPAAGRPSPAISRRCAPSLPTSWSPRGRCHDPGRGQVRRRVFRRPRGARAGACRRRRGLRGAARSSPDARAPAEGRSRQDLDPCARRPVPRLHRGSAPAAA